MTHIAFSRLATRVEVGQDPVISTHLNTVKPCFGPDRDRLVLGTGGSDLIKFPIENEDPIENCPTFDWRQTTYMDQRYNTIGYTNLWMLQEAAGVN